MPAVKGGGGDKAVLFGDLGERRVGEGGGDGEKDEGKKNQFKITCNIFCRGEFLAQFLKLFSC